MKSSTSTRRQFFRGTGLAAGTLAGLGIDLSPAAAAVPKLKIRGAREVPSICPYCAVGCGVIIHTLGDRARNAKAAVVHIEGDPDQPVSRGTLCPKGITLKDDITHKNRLTKPQVRRPGSDKWEDITWDKAISEIAAHVKKTRDTCFVAKNAKGQTVNRNPGIAMIGGCTDTNEFNYLQWKVITALGVPYRDTQARV